VVTGVGSLHARTRPKDTQTLCGCSRWGQAKKSQAPRPDGAWFRARALRYVRRPLWAEHVVAATGLLLWGHRGGWAVVPGRANARARGLGQAQRGAVAALHTWSATTTDGCSRRCSSRCSSSRWVRCLRRMPAQEARSGRTHAGMATRRHSPFVPQGTCAEGRLHSNGPWGTAFPRLGSPQ
jgi:hypothetical protein